MSLEKIGEKSLYNKKADAHMDSWKSDIEEAIGEDPRELGIHNREELENRLKRTYQLFSERKELDFIKNLKEINDEVGVYLVGGSVRDAILGKDSKDIDLVINRIEPIQLVDVLADFGEITFDRNPKADIKRMESSEKENLIKNSYGVIKFKPNGSRLKELIDIAFPREDDYSGSGQSGIRGIKRDTETKADHNLNINRDLERRDFTINAIAINLANGEIIDPFDGIEDLIKRKIRTVGSPVERIINEDFSRGFRALRFACIFNTDIESGTKKAIKEIFKPSEKSAQEIYHNNPELLSKVLNYEEKVKQQFVQPEGNLPKCLQVFWDKEQGKPRMAVAKEVMSKEILKAIDARPGKLIKLLDEIGGLKIILPEIFNLKNLEQPRKFHGEGDVFKHTLMLLNNLPLNASLRLKLAGLLHDTGKVDTLSKTKEGKITFHRHEQASTQYVTNVAERFRFSDKLKKGTEFLVKNHMLPLRDAKEMKPNKLYNIFLKDKILGNELISLARADALASLPEKGEPDLENINILIDRLKDIKQRFNDQDKIEIPKIITGEDVIILGIKRGPLVGKILAEVQEAQLDGRIKSRDEAIDLIKKYA
ncbi:MAG: HD domain-containing protein [Patescibacteria group bacterium]|nr:HD domain-containing protein [Patescibacteria group bacterium]